jgi:hypothetical protein
MKIQDRRDAIARLYSNSLMKVAKQSSNRTIGAYSPNFVEGYLEASISDLLNELQLTTKQLDVVERNLSSRQRIEEQV